MEPERGGCENQWPCWCFQNIPRTVFSVKGPVSVNEQEEPGPRRPELTALWYKQWTGLAGDMGARGAERPIRGWTALHVPRLTLVCAPEAEVSCAGAPTLCPQSPSALTGWERASSKGKPGGVSPLRCDVLPGHSQSQKQRVSGSRYVSATSD